MDEDLAFALESRVGREIVQGKFLDVAVLRVDYTGLGLTYCCETFSREGRPPDPPTETELEDVTQGVVGTWLTVEVHLLRVAD